MELKKIRVVRGLTQKEMADILGYHTPSAYRKLETGEQQLRVDQAVKLAKKLDVPISFFIPESYSLSNKCVKDEKEGRSCN